MVVKLQKTEQGLTLLLPDDTLERLRLTADTEVFVTLKPEQQQIIVSPVSQLLPEVDEEFARQVSDFIDQYRPALEALAQ